MRRLLALITLAASSLTAQTAPRPAAARPAAARPAATPSYKDLKFPALKPIPVPPVESVVLPNGMRLYLLEDHELPVINGAARVRTGNLFDPPDKIGLATLTGMVMRTGGTKNQPGEELDKSLENVAAAVETSIAESSGSVSFSSLKENVDPVLAIFHDVITAPEFRQDKIDLAKNQLHSSVARRNDDPGSIAGREFSDRVYGKDSPYGWQMEHATIDAITRADMLNFYQRYFFPSNIMLAVWGDFDAKEMQAKLQKLFADWTVKQPPVPDFPKVTAKPVAGTYLAVKRDTAQTFFTMGHLGGVLDDKDYPALEIMSAILGEGGQSRLFQLVRTKMGNAYNISADWGANYDHPGLFEVSGSTKSYSTVETLRAVEKEVERIRTTEVTEDELKTAKETALNSLVFAFDSRTKTLGRVLTYAYYGYPKDFIQQYQKALSEVTRADVLRVAKTHLDPDHFTIVAVGNPEAFEEPLDKLGAPVKSIDLTIPFPPRPSGGGPAKARQLLARAQTAAGGVDKLSAVKDFFQSMEVDLVPAAGGLKVQLRDRWLSPESFRQDSETPAGNISAYYDGKEGWISMPEGVSPLAGPQLSQVQGDRARLYFRLLLSDRIAGRTVTGSGDQSIDVTMASGEPVKVKFDSTTGLLKSVSYQAVNLSGPGMEVEDVFSDFRDVDGIKVPFHVVINQGGQKFADVTVKEAKFNSGLKLSDLEQKPAAEVKK
ncbi:MAG TPA: pitrilysin family protein [Candidatus Sulfopaludibacter sp.]|jgi:zinc protease|nr:pitrilysin family protein [Candidatus Sulfopaludibacter sp.]